MLTLSKYEKDKPVPMLLLALREIGVVRLESSVLVLVSRDKGQARVKGFFKGKDIAGP